MLQCYNTDIGVWARNKKTCYTKMCFFIYELGCKKLKNEMYEKIYTSEQRERAKNLRFCHSTMLFHSLFDN